MKARFDFKPKSYRYALPRLAEDTASLYYSTLNGYEEIGSRYYLDRSGMNNVLVSMTLKGTAVLQCEGESSPLSEGSMAFIDCRSRHIFYPTCDDWHILFVHISGGDVFAVQREFYEAFGLVCKDFPQAVFMESMDKVFRMEQASEANACEISAELYTILMKILSHCRRAGQGGPVFIRKAQMFIQENYPSGIGVDEVAKSVGVSKFHLEREYKKHMGQPIARAIADKRFERSRALLAGGDMSVERVAEEVGFASVQPLIRIYKSRLGVTPSYYKKYIDHI